MSSKRSLAKHLGVSTITVENAYDQLISEGYLHAEYRRGYFVSEIKHPSIDCLPSKTTNYVPSPPESPQYFFDFSSNTTDAERFPFSIMAKVMRETIASGKEELLLTPPCCGVLALREAICAHLYSFRGMRVNPNQVVIGAGTEYLYNLLVKLLGAKRRYCIENPGYRKLAQIYKSNGAELVCAGLDHNGMSVEQLRESGADIAHINPTHHFPTGLTMPISRRYELLAWANEDQNRYIIEDDYDSEFRLNGKPIPTLQSIDASGKVIYLNTFTKSLSPTIRISYMVLPPKLACAFYEKLSFYSCTVSNFEQYSLASFISEGHFEKHINRMRLHYTRRRTAILEAIREHFSETECSIIENDSGLHFLLEFHTELSDARVKELLAQSNIHINCVSDYQIEGPCLSRHQFIFCFSNINMDVLPEALGMVHDELFGDLSAALATEENHEQQ